jgi:PAS domain S-box-containing protein
MTDEDKTREQLLEELEAARQRNAELEANEAGRKQADDVATIRNRILQVFLTSQDDTVFSMLMSVVLEAAHSEYGVFGYFRPDGAFVVPAVTREMYWEKCNVPEKEIIFQKASFGGIWKRAIAQKQTLFDNEGPFKTPPGHVAIKNTMVTPVIYRGEVISAIHVANKAADYSEEDQRVLEMIARQVAPVLAARLERDRGDAERKRAEEALREGERKTRAILDQTFSLVGVLKPDGTLIEANKTALRFGDLEASDVIGKPFWECPWWTHSPEQQDRVRDGVRKAAAGEFIRFEAHHPTPEGGTLYIDGSLNPVKDEAGKVVHIVAEGRDVTERKRAEERSRASEERYRTLVEENPHGVQEIDRDGIIVFANAAHCEMLGYEEAGLVGRSVADFLVPGPQRDELPRYLRTLVEDQPAPTPYSQKNVKKGGEVRDVEVSWNYLRDEEGHVRGFISVLTDVTERKQAEEERRDLEAQIQQAQKMESLGIVAGGIAHDFNNLLMGILGNADLALYDLPSGSPTRPLVEAILQASHQAAGLTNQMLAYSGKGRFQVEELDINALVQDMLSLLASATSKKVGLKFDLADDLPAIEADATQIRQIVMNLVTNAAEAIGDEGGLVTVRTDKEECDRAFLDETQMGQGLQEGSYVTFEVSDTGCGMDEGTKGKVFEPFFTTKLTGRGLGLAGVFGIVRGHKGAIKVESEPGRGTTFTALFPALDKLTKPVETHARAKTERSGSGTILLVDDEETVREVAERFLERIGFTVLVAEDGAKALEVFRQHQDKITCVLLDLSMPNIDGEEAFAELRKIRGDVRVVLSSGYSEQELDERFAGEGLAGFIQKPYSIAALREKLAQVLGG